MGEKYTEQEKMVLDALAKAWNEFLQLDVVHPDHQTDYRRAIHEAQRIVMPRLF